MAKWVCEVCGYDVTIWTDLHGERVCTRCGTPYQFLQYDENHNRLDKPPAINIVDKCIPVLKKYWEETHRHMGLGTFITTNAHYADYEAFCDWFDKQPEAKELEE